MNEQATSTSLISWSCINNLVLLGGIVDSQLDFVVCPAISSPFYAKVHLCIMQKFVNPFEKKDV